MSAYYKLIGGLVGNLVAVVLVYLATKGLATCAPVNGVQACTVAGLSDAQITAIVMTLLNAVGVHQAPANAPSATP